MYPVFIRSAELGAPFTDKPTIPLRDSMQRAAERAIAAAGLAPREVDALFVAAMGSFEHEHFMGALPLWLASELELRRADISPMLIGSSETGAWALRSAVRALRHDDAWQHVLVVSGEQMNPLVSRRARTPEARFHERRERNRTISQVVDEADRHYALNMLRMSDLIMDLLSHLHDWRLDDLTDLVLPFMALEKYRRVRGYPYGQFHDNSYETVEQYHRRVRLTHYFRLDDVTPTSTGCVALVLSREPSGPKRTVEILGMGQGYVPASLTKRIGDPTRMQSIRDAYARATADASVGRDWLLECDFAVIHDAFPSIEYFFLRELELDPIEIVRRLVSGWSNPFGGLKGCGHALGASGMLQVAKSFHAFTQDPRYIDPIEHHSPYPELVREPPFRTCFTTSVGGVLTNVLVTLLAAHDGTVPQRMPARTVPGSVDLPAVDTEDAPAETTATSREYRVLARTLIRHTLVFGDDEHALTRTVPAPWIYLIERRAGSDSEPRRLAWAADRFDVGDIVRCEPHRIDGTRLYRIEPVPGGVRPETYTESPNDIARAHFLIDLERRMASLGHIEHAPRYLETPAEVVDGCLAYAELPLSARARQTDPPEGEAPAEGHRCLKGRVVASDLSAPLGEVVEIRTFEREAGPATAKSALATWRKRHATRHPALPELYDVGELTEDGLVYSVRELPHGVALSTWVSGARPIDAERTTVWARAIAGALAAVHEAGLVHGCVDPQHVVITARDRVFLVEPRLLTPLATATWRDDIRGLGQILLALAVRGEETVSDIADVATRCLGWSNQPSFESAGEIVAALPRRHRRKPDEETSR